MYSAKAITRNTRAGARDIVKRVQGHDVLVEQKGHNSVIRKPRFQKGASRDESNVFNARSAKQVQYWNT